MCVPATMKNALVEIAPLGCYLLFVFFSFCDGFKMRPARKIMWAVYFLAFSLVSLWATGRYELFFIIPLSSLFAFVLAWFQRRDNRLANG